MEQSKDKTQQNNTLTAPAAQGLKAKVNGVATEFPAFRLSDGFMINAFFGSGDDGVFLNGVSFIVSEDDIGKPVVPGEGLVNVNFFKDGELHDWSVGKLTVHKDAVGGLYYGDLTAEFKVGDYPYSLTEGIFSIAKQ